MSKRDKCLDQHAWLYGLKRKRYFLFFKESDEKLRQRIIEVITKHKPLSEKEIQIEKRRRGIVE